MSEVETQLADALYRVECFLSSVHSSGYKAKHGPFPTPNYWLVKELIKQSRSALAEHRRQNDPTRVGSYADHIPGY